MKMRLPHEHTQAVGEPENAPSEFKHVLLRAGGEVQISQGTVIAVLDPAPQLEVGGFYGPSICSAIRVA